MASKNLMDKQFSKLEEAHLNYLEAAQVDFDENQDEANYLNHPNQDWNDARKMYGDFLKERKQLKVNIKRMAKFKTKQKILKASIMNFGTPAENITNLIKEGISSTDVRAESNRFEEMAKKLFHKKDDIHSISSGINDFDAEGFKTRLRMTVIDKVKS